MEDRSEQLIIKLCTRTTEIYLKFTVDPTFHRKIGRIVG